MRLGRAVAITATLSLIGAVIGAAVGGVLVSAWSLTVDFSRGGRAGTVAVGTLFSAGLGAVLAPTTAWLFLRRVQIGRAIAHTTIGTALGAALGILIERFVLDRIMLQLAIVGALIGFFAAAVRLRLTTRPPSAHAGVSSIDAHGG